ncbi:MAG TPA: zf-HC2 domain-containing protein [Actinomycetota bacterium]|nr:zf-HC2 domain-containing protein [Actinomycetota bacterium]
MNHPYELLTDLLDGTLDEGDLAGVEAHLDSCDSCRRDIADARLGIRAARSLPVEDPPADLHARVVGADGGRGAPAWYRWAGVAAAAAAVVAIAIALPNVGDGSNQEAGGVAADATSAPEFTAPPGDVVVSQEDRDYDAQALEDLATSATAERSGAATNAAGSAALDATAAVRCVTRAFNDQQSGRLTRLIRARFEGEEAYIAVYLEGPGAGEPPDTATVWAASSESCMVLSFAEARI